MKHLNSTHFNSLYIYYIFGNTCGKYTKRQFDELDKQLYYIIIKKNVEKL